MDLIQALGWLDPARYVEAPQATPEQLLRFHDPDYVQALLRAEAAQTLSDAEKTRFNIGINGNPIYPEIFRRPATASGGTLKAMEIALAASGPVRIYHLAGGTHHGRRGQAYGFCYLNDIALGILALLDAGVERVAYVDLDAHHGDGVELAFADDPRVLTISIHEGDRWPRTGGIADQIPGALHNFPMPPDLNDSEFGYVVEAGVIPTVLEFEPEVLVIQGGCDALADDPMTGLALSNTALWAAVADLLPLAPRVVALGGGGYNPWAVSRCWAGIWGVIDGRAPPDRLPPSAEAVQRGLTWRRSQGRNPPAHWFESLADAPRPGAVRTEVREVVAAALQGKGKAG